MSLVLLMYKLYIMITNCKLQLKVLSVLGGLCPQFCVLFSLQEHFYCNSILSFLVLCYALIDETWPELPSYVIILSIFNISGSNSGCGIILEITSEITLNQFVAVISFLLSNRTSAGQITKQYSHLNNLLYYSFPHLARNFEFVCSVNIRKVSSIHCFPTTIAYT